MEIGERMLVDVNRFCSPPITPDRETRSWHTHYQYLTFLKQWFIFIKQSSMGDYVKSLQPNNKKQQEEYERYVEHLNLKTDGEKFILLCVLNFDWRRQKILQSIKFIKESEDGSFIDFHITMRAPSITTVYSIGNPYHEEGWSLKTLYERQQRTYSQMDYYTNSY